jgi:hypothetical protein
MQCLKKLVQRLHAHEKRSFFGSILRVLSQKYLRPISKNWDILSLSKTPLDVAGAAALLQDFTSGDNALTDFLVEQLTKPESSPLIASEGLRRAVLAMLAFDTGRFISTHLNRILLICTPCRSNARGNRKTTRALRRSVVCSTRGDCAARRYIYCDLFWGLVLTQCSNSSIATVSMWICPPEATYVSFHHCQVKFTNARRLQPAQCYLTSGKMVRNDC